MANVALYRKIRKQDREKAAVAAIVGNRLHACDLREKKSAAQSRVNTKGLSRIEIEHGKKRIIITTSLQFAKLSRK